MTDTPFGQDPDAAGQDDLTSAQATVDNLREQLNDLVHARSRAESEIRRLTTRSEMPGADASLAEIIKRYENQSATLTSEVAVLRATLRGAEGTLERLRADQAGA